MKPAWLPAAGAGASALLLGAAATIEAPWHFAALIALAPWMLALRGASWRAALGSAVLLAMAFTAVAFSWFPATLAAYTRVPMAAAWLIALAMAPAVLQPQLIAAALARVAAERWAGRPAAAVAFVAAYAGGEWLLPKLFADTVGHALFASPWLRQAADLGGPRLLTICCLAVSELLVAAVGAPRSDRRPVRPLAGAVVILLSLAAYGAWRAGAVADRTRAAARFRAGIVQAAITKYDKLAAEIGKYETVRRVLDAHLELSRALLARGRLDLLVWPETVYPTTFGAPKSEAGAEFDAEIAAVPRASGVPLVLGSFESSGGAEHNAAFFVSPADGPARAAVYRKTLLFPLTEYVPGWLEGPRARSAMPWMGTWKPGPGARAVTIALRGGPISLAPLICYEAVHPGYVAASARAGANAILTLSNDAWFPDRRGARLHLIVAAFRSIETRLPQIRATNSGISALVLPDGEIVSPTGFEERTAIVVDVPRLPPSTTLAARWGDWTGPAALGVLALLFGALGWRAARGRATNRAWTRPSAG